MHKSRKKAAMDARLLKPSISGERSDYEEAADRAVSTGSKQLDLNAPLLSVRRNRAENGTAHETQHASLHNAAVNRCSSNLGNVSRRPLIPFFTWELPQAQKSAAEAAAHIQEEPPAAAPESRGEEFVHPAPRALAPPPRQHIEAAADARGGAFGKQKNRGANWDFLEARSEVEIPQTEANSVAPSYRVSLIDGEGDGDPDEECEEAPISYNAADKDMILRRFLPAATAVAKEMVSSLQQQHDGRVWEIWKPLAIRPPPSPAPAKLEQQQDRDRQQGLAESRRKVTKKKKMLRELFSSLSWDQQEGKKFGELIRMQSQDEFGEVELDEVGPGASCSSQSGGVGGIICGLFPVIRMLRSNYSSRQQEPSAAKSKARIWRKLEPQEQRGDDDRQHRRGSWEADRHNGDGSSTEWWSDEGDRDEEFEDANDSWRQNCRYTPSRGGLKSPAIRESKGFLGMPRDRIVGKTFIKRMYPVNLENVTTTTTTSDLRVSRSSVMSLQKHRIDDAADSDSSDSLRSIKLDKCSSGSRQSSSNGGSMEKVFCLDTLNQVRESGRRSGSGAANHHDHHQILKPSRSSKQNNGGSSDQLGDFVEESAQILYTPHRSRKLQLLKSLQQDDSLRSSDDLRICWHDHQNEDHGAGAAAAAVAQAHPNLVLPNPKGPSQSWLKKTLPNKPPRVGKNNQTIFSPGP